MEELYKIISDHYDACFKKYGDTPQGLDWPNKDDMNKRYKVMFELINNKLNQNITLLDFGCGTAGLYTSIISKYTKINYSGLDISNNFYQYCIKEFPKLKFYNKDILKNNDIPNFDYIICNGVFTVKRELSYDKMNQFFRKIIKTLWEKCNVGIAFNIMSKHVDWERDDLFHLGYDNLASFIKNDISNNFIIRNDYGLYEYTVYVYRDLNE